MQAVYAIYNKATLVNSYDEAGAFAILFGNATFGDMPPSLYWYDNNSVLTDSFPDVVRTPGNGDTGAWLLMPLQQSNWSESTPTKSTYISNKPSLAAVATSGSYSDLSNLPSSPSVNNSPDRSIVTTAAAANGTRLSTTRNAFVNYTVTIATTATIGGNASGTIVLEICSTNSSTAGDWIEVSRVTNGQSISLALALQSVQTFSGSLNAMVPSGWYCRQRSIATNGSPTFTAGVQQEVLL